MSLLHLAPLVVVVGCVVIALPVLRMSGLVTVLVLVRTLSDLGSASPDGPLLPAASLNAVLALVMVGLLLVPTEQRLPSSLRKVLTALVMLLLLGTAVGLVRFGSLAGSLQEALRLVSVIAVFIIGTRLRPDDAATGRQIAWVSGLPAAVLVVGFLMQVPATLLVSGRAAGGFSHANAAAAYFAIGALACLGWWLRRHDVRLLWAGLLSLVALGLTESLGGLAAFAASALVLVLLSSRLSPRRVGPVLALLLVVWTVVTFTGVGQRVSRLFAGASASENGDSLAWRFVNWRLLLQRWQEHPWLGFGLGSTRSEVAPLGAPPHSLPVQILVETGVVGLAVAVALLLALVWLVARRARAHRAAAVLSISLLLLAVVNGAESNLLNYTPALYLLALVVGRVSATQRRSASFDGPGAPAERTRRAPHPLSQGVPTLVVEAPERVGS